MVAPHKVESMIIVSFSQFDHEIRIAAAYHAGICIRNYDTPSRYCSPRVYHLSRFCPTNQVEWDTLRYSLIGENDTQYT